MHQGARSHIPQTDRKVSPSLRTAWLVVLFAYIGLFGSLLLATKGLPYAIDNNESFSSLMHARHLYEGHIGDTKGLTDEVSAWHAAANPYVHTHQGNFPRLFAFVLYVFGARTIETQIVLTTFTVGLAALWLAFRFLCTIGPPLFAAIGCLILITDYGLFGQWQVDTYRVWYGFLFFGALFWVSHLDRYRKWPMLVCGAIAFAALFYGEYVYATFVGITAGCYGLVCYGRRIQLLLRCWLGILVGGAAAAGVLLAQLVAYMGWANVKLDIAYTLAARNMASDKAFTELVDKFYRDHRIIFWNNYFDIANSRTLKAFATSFFEKHLQYYSPWIGLCTLVILAGALLGLLRRTTHQDPDSRNSGNRVARWSVFFASRVLPGVVLAAIAVLVLRYLRPLFDDSSATLWSAALGLEPPAWLGWLSYALASAIALTLAVAGTRRMVGSENGLVGLFSLSLCVVVAYAIVYRVFTGYIYSGYLNRQAPFLVFWTDIVLAGALYLVVETTRRAFADSWNAQAPAALPLSGSVLLLSFAAAWFTLQLSYLIVVPPDSQAFLKLLSKRPFRGSSFVVNSYAAPEAEETHAWAYAETSLFSGRVRLGPDGYQVEHDRQYLWFADAESNKSYLKPDYGLLIDQPASIEQALKAFTSRSPWDKHPIAFESTGIVQRTQEPLQPFLRHKLVRTDGVSYSIVKFDWDFPPFLRPVNAAMRAAAEGMTFQQKLYFSESSQEELRRWRVEIEPLATGPGLGRDKATTVLNEASIDGRPIFSREALSEAGWVPASTSANPSSGAWIGIPGQSERVAAVAVGDVVTLRLLEGPDRGTASVTINDLEQPIDLRKARAAEHVISLSTAEAHDKFTAIPRLSPGMYVNAWLTNADSGPEAILGYRYAHQEAQPEDGTTVRVYNEPRPGQWQLVDSITFLGVAGIPVRLGEFRSKNPDTLREYARMQAKGDVRTYQQWLTDHLTAFPNDRSRWGILASDAYVDAKKSDSAQPTPEYRAIPLPQGLQGRLQVSVTPSTRTKAGPEFFSLPFDARRAESGRNGTLDPVQIESPGNFEHRELPYGYIRLRLRFPTNRVPQAEPIVSLGVEEAGDFVYVIYSDATHVRIGFDHWFKGGPLSPPIPIDYARVHDLEISMGSLFPPSEDIIFVGMSTKEVSALKENVRVTLDGKTVIAAPSEFWDSPPTQLAIGKNDIKGTSENTRFSGEIIECKRIWPEPQ